jgi:hypothetical protein
MIMDVGGHEKAMSRRLAICLTIVHYNGDYEVVPMFTPCRWTLFISANSGNPSAISTTDAPLGLGRRHFRGCGIIFRRSEKCEYAAAQTLHYFWVDGRHVFWATAPLLILIGRLPLSLGRFGQSRRLRRTRRLPCRI